MLNLINASLHNILIKDQPLLTLLEQDDPHAIVIMKHWLQVNTPETIWEVGSFYEWTPKVASYFPPEAIQEGIQARHDLELVRQGIILDY